MGLGSVKESEVVFLSIAGGYIWDRKKDKSDPDYAEQQFERADKTTGTRAGARYESLQGMVSKVEFRTHQEYGQSLNVSITTSEEVYILSVSTNNRYSQDFMKCLLKMDLKKELLIKPYDFIGSDKKRAQGISFKQDGKKVDLKVEDAPTQEAEWFKNADKKKIKRFFEDLSDWFVAEVEESVIPNIVEVEAPKRKKKVTTSSEEVEEERDDVAQDAREQASEPKKNIFAKKNEEVKKEETKTATPLAMKKVLRKYIEDNYEGHSLPDLPKEKLVEWYNLAMAEEELPIEEEEDPSEVETDELEDQLNNLL